jgi:hypothetical protein
MTPCSLVERRIIFHQITRRHITEDSNLRSPCREILKSCIPTIFDKQLYVKKTSVFWGVTPCRPFKVNQRSGGTCRLHFQGRRISQARNQGEECGKLHARFLLGLFFDTENGGDMFFRNVGWLSTDYTALYPRDRTLHSHSCEKLKSYNFI